MAKLLSKVLETAEQKFLSIKCGVSGFVSRRVLTRWSPSSVNCCPEWGINIYSRINLALTDN